MSAVLSKVPGMAEDLVPAVRAALATVADPAKAEPMRARTDPQWVLDFVAGHELSPLSRREALKHLGGSP